MGQAENSNERGISAVELPEQNRFSALDRHLGGAPYRSESDVEKSVPATRSGAFAESDRGSTYADVHLESFIIV